MKQVNVLLAQNSREDHMAKIILNIEVVSDDELKIKTEQEGCNLKDQDLSNLFAKLAVGHQMAADREENTDGE